MLIVTLRLPDIKIVPTGRPSACPHCGAGTLQRWGQYAKPVLDPHTTAMVQRYRCTACRRTFRHHPTGMDHADQSLRMRTLLVLMSVLGLSYRSVEAVCAVFTPPLAA